MKQRGLWGLIELPAFAQTCLIAAVPLPTQKLTLPFCV